MTATQQLRLLADVYRQSFLARATHNMKKGRLMSGTIALFMVGWLIGGCFLFHAGLKFVHNVTGVGPLLLERIIYLLHFFFFVMLVLSNAVLLYGALFKGKETPWLLTMPLQPRAIFCWKVVECMLVSSWGVVLLSAPIMVSIAWVFRADGWFYVKTFLTYIPFLMLPGAVGGMLTMLMVRYWGRVAKVLLAGLLIYALWHSIAGYLASQEVLHSRTPSNLNRAFEKLLGHTDLAMNRFMPSSWVSTLVVGWARGYGTAGQGWFFSLLLVSWALFTAWVCAVLVSPALHKCWNVSQRRRALAVNRKHGQRRTVADIPFSRGLRWHLPGFRSHTAGLVWKDLMEFRRDAGQWVPCLIVFSLLLLYALNLNDLQTMTSKDLFRFGIRYLNFGVCCLTLSTLTTRFIFPLFSLEGRRLWIVGLAPFPMQRVFWQKLALFASGVCLGTGTLMFISGTNLGLSGLDLTVYAGSIVLMSVGLTSMALALGVLFPNFSSVSPARIVSGFGGTLCLIMSLAFITLFLAIIILPGLYVELKLGRDHPSAGWIQVASVAGLFGLTGLFGGVPAWFALKRMKQVEMLGQL